MRPLATGVLLLLTIFLYGNPDDKGCDSYHCSKYDWDHGNHRFDPYSIQWPLHHNGEVYKDIHDGGEYHVYIVYYDHYYKKKSAPLKEFRKMPYCPDPHFLKDGVPMEYYFECEADYISKPHWVDSKCSMIGKSHEDQVFYFDGPACSKIIREWALIDWCKYEPNTHADANDDDHVLVYDMTNYKTYFAFNPHYGAKHDGYYKFKQVIKIIDSTKPEIADCDDITFDLKGDCHGHVKLKNKVIDAGPCYGEKMSINLEIFDHYGHSVHKEWFKAANHEEFWVSAGYLYPGKYHVKWKVSDGCNNKSECVQYLTVVDNSQPSLLCIQNISSSISDDYGMTIWAKDFVLKASDPCGYDSGITFSFSDREYVPSMTFTCADGFGFHDLMIYATAANGAVNSCYVELFLSDHFTCSDDMQIAGLVFDRYEEPLEGVEVDIMQSSNMVATSSSNTLGRYVVEGIPTSKSVEYIEPHIYANPKAGLDAYDLIGLLRHITRAEKFKDVLEYVAADVNEDGTIDMNDYWDLATIVYGLPHRVANVKPWKFIDHKLYRAGIIRASQLTAPIAVRTFRHRYDIMGVKNGDVDFSFSARPKAKSRSALPLTMTSEGSKKFVSVQQPLGLAALEVIIDDPRMIDMIKFDQNLTVGAEVFSSENEGKTRLILMRSTALDVSTGSALFTIKADAGAADFIPEVVIYHREGADVVDANAMIRENVFNQSIAGDDFSVTPNPFSAAVRLEFNVVSERPVDVLLRNTAGQLLSTWRFKNSGALKGAQLNLGDELSSGIYLLEVRGDFGSVSRRLVKSTL